MTPVRASETTTITEISPIAHPGGLFVASIKLGAGISVGIAVGSVTTGGNVSLVVVDDPIVIPGLVPFRSFCSVTVDEGMSVVDSVSVQVFVEASPTVISRSISSVMFPMFTIRCTRKNDCSIYAINYFTYNNYLPAEDSSKSEAANTKNLERLMQIIKHHDVSFKSHKRMIAKRFRVFQ